MKKLTTVAVIFFVVGVLAGFGFGRVTKKAPANSGLSPYSSDMLQGADTAGQSMPQDVGGVLNGTMQKDEGAAMAQPTSDMMAGKNEVKVADQAAGNKVILSSVLLEKSTWVVVHEDRDGKPGNILGAHRFNAGVSLGVVELVRGTTAGGVYYTMLHIDDGERGFDYKKDIPLTDADGNFVLTRFMAN